MNITESNDINAVLSHLLSGERPPDRVIVAAMRLADRANAALHAGLSSRHVTRRWPLRAEQSTSDTGTKERSR
jgi:hypothetical protein